MKVVNGAVPSGNYAANTEIKNDMKITTFGAETNFNSADQVNRVYKKNGTWYCEQYEAVNGSFENRAGADKFINYMASQGYTVYNRGCSEAGGSSGYYEMMTSGSKTAYYNGLYTQVIMY